MLNKEQEKKNAEALFESGAVEKYSKEYFQRNGAKGGKKRWKGLLKKEIKEEMAKVRQAKLSTD